MLPDELVERLTRLATFSRDPQDVAARLQRLIETPANRWRKDWIAALFPGISETDARTLVALVDSAGAQKPHGFVPGRLEALRRKLTDLSLDGFIVPQADEHLGEYIPARNQRLAWLTGFTGSAGMAVITRDKAWLFIDGRYMEQAKIEVDPTYIEARHFQKPPKWQFLAEALEPGAALGYDPRLHAVAELESIHKDLSKSRIELTPVAENPIDALWTDRPAPAFSPIVERPVELAGKSMRDKLERVVVALQAEKIDALVLGQLDAIAWLYNLRGGDLANTPVAESFSIVFADGRAELFVEKEKLTPEAGKHLGGHVSVRPVSELEEALVDVGHRGLTIGLDPATSTGWMKTTLAAAGATVRPIQDPTLLERVRKNTGEIQSLKDAMVRDGACVVQFLRWFYSLPANALPDELELVDALARFRGKDPYYRGPSFPSIVGIGPNGAIVHYHPKPDTNRRLEPGVLVLIDSGGQFLTGTTDITRTLIHSQPSAAQRKVYTAVLKGHIALATTRFPKGTVGTQLDAIARSPLWQIGMNYDHGTGHGIGAFLGVHEGPVRIAPGANVPLEPNMLLSNEPGAYLPGQFGIRLENSVIVVNAGDGEAGEAFLAFETLSLAPFDRQLIDAELLSAPERAWLNEYHARVLAAVGPHISGSDADWLERATRPL